ncbi:carbohydrate ABC transporter permease [Salinibius halmophilus]|uniref:carbohydrate ABC transporter permease n=1 Tax=Salinibius halmophilus TaxID=1853216 RepID=UPI000E670C2C|nr:sugar ABC transporter permease [Salinibius halmophilus]
MSQNTDRLMSYRSKAEIQKWLLLMPGVILYGIFNFIPLIGLFGMALMDWKGIGPMEYVGLENFKLIFFDPYYRDGFLNALGNNIIFFGVIITAMLVIGTIFALLLSFKTYGREVYKVIFFLPYPLAGAAVAVLMNMIFRDNGPVNTLLVDWNWAEKPIPFMGDKDLSIYMLASFFSWHRMGFAIMLILSAIVAVRLDLVEAAFLDGARRLQAIRHVVLPVLMPAIIVIFVIIMVDTFNNADMTLLIFGPAGGPGYGADVMGSYLYRAAFGAGSTDPVLGYGVAAVVGILTSLVIMPAAIFSAIQNNKK